MPPVTTGFGTDFPQGAVMNTGLKADAKAKHHHHETKVVVDETGIAHLINTLNKEGYTTIGPRVRDGAVVYEEIDSTEDFPIGMSDEQEGGHYRLVRGTPGAYFEYVCGPTSWKKYLFPPKQKLWAAERKENGFHIETKTEKTPAYAFIGVRPCELAAIRIQDKVFGFNKDPHKDNAYTDSSYAELRSKALFIAVNCNRSGKTCFCASMGTGPRVEKGQGYDIVLTEIIENNKHDFIAEAGSEQGAHILAHLPHRAVSDADTRAAEKTALQARRQNRSMMPEVAALLKKNPEHPRWESVAERCLACGNCTMSCPTCFCNTVEDTTDLLGDHAERWRLWDSCFSIDFSYIHGGSIRKEAKSRYRQWMSHKLSYWHEQFGTSGCVGCGRCITWCPVGIDITEEAKAIKYNSR
jgi:sulfhydrogenase subunit beta (sulfur reductase)